MKAFTLSALSTLFAGLTLAHPVDLSKRTGGFSEVDITILQFALTLEHLENTFYKTAFASFQKQDFLNLGFDEEFFVNLEFIAADESAHVQFLIAAISSAGVAPVQPCTYNFGVTDIPSFVTVSAILESVGTSAYLGAAPFVNSKEILAVAASIMATEGLHTSLQRSSLGAVGAANPFQTPLDPNSVFTLASQFIVSCPPSNPPLPFKAFPSLKVNAQPCFNEIGNSGNYNSYSTASVDYSKVWSNVNRQTDSSTTTTTTKTTVTATAHDMTKDSSKATTTDHSMTMTMDHSMGMTTDHSMAVTMTTKTETAPPMATSAAAYKRSELDARTFSGSCSAPGPGSQMQLVPDFSQAHGIDFSRIEVIFVTIISGLDVISIQATFQRDGSIVFIIPPSISGGQIFIFITIADISGRSFNDNEVLFGPAVFELAPSLPSFLI